MDSGTSNRGSMRSSVRISGSSKVLEHKQNKGCFKTCKQAAREKLKYNTWSLNKQIRFILFLIFITFFIIYEGFLVTFTNSQYKNTLLKKVEKKEEDIFQSRIAAATQSASSSYFFFEQSGIERAQQLAEAYNKLSNTVTINFDKNLKFDNFKSRQKYGDGPQCTKDYFNQLTGNSMKVHLLKNQIEQGIIFNSGRKKNYNAKRILFLLESETRRSNQKSICIYPYENLENVSRQSQPFFKNHAFYNRLRNGEVPFVVERDTVDYFEPEANRIINFWAPIKDSNGRFAGAIGIQFDQQKLVRIFNTEAIKQPYPASFIAIYENQADIKDINLFHFYYQGSLTKKDVLTLKKNTKLFAWEYIYEQYNKAMVNDQGFDDDEIKHEHTEFEPGKIMDLGMARSPLPGIEARIKYKQYFKKVICPGTIKTECMRDQQILVIVGFDHSLQKLKFNNTEAMISSDLGTFHIVLAIVNLLVFAILTVGVDRLLYTRITKPITQLHHDITDKKELKRQRQKHLAEQQRRKTSLFQTKKNSNSRKSEESSIVSQSNISTLHSAESMDEERQMKAEKEDLQLNEVEALTDVLFKFFKSDQGGGTNVGDPNQKIVEQLELNSVHNPFTSIIRKNNLVQDQNSSQSSSSDFDNKEDLVSSNENRNSPYLERRQSITEHIQKKATGGKMPSSNSKPVSAQKKFQTPIDFKQENVQDELDELDNEIFDGYKPNKKPVYIAAQNRKNLEEQFMKKIDMRGSDVFKIQPKKSALKQDSTIFEESEESLSMSNIEIELQDEDIEHVDTVWQRQFDFDSIKYVENYDQQ